MGFWMNLIVYFDLSLEIFFFPLLKESSSLGNHLDLSILENLASNATQPSLSWFYLFLAGFYLALHTDI